MRCWTASSVPTMKTWPSRPGAVWLRGFARSFEAALLPALRSVTDAAPFRHMLTPGGRRMSVAMTSCGRLGWVSDGRGYRYDANDPATGRPWPPMPASFARTGGSGRRAGGIRRLRPDSCLVNRYEPGAKLSLHQDRDERDFSAPIVSVSLGLAAVFLFGGMHRGDADRARATRAWRRGRVGWAVETPVSRRAAAQRWRARTDGPLPDQPDIPKGGVR